MAEYRGPAHEQIRDGEVLVEVRLDESRAYQGVTAYWRDDTTGVRGQVFTTPLAEFLGRELRAGARVRPWGGPDSEQRIAAIVSDDLTLCAGGEQVTGRVPTLTCRGQVLLVDFVPGWSYPSARPAPTRVYLCGMHLPETLPARLGDVHPVVVWDWLRESVRGESWTEHSDRHQRMEAAMKAAHGLADAVANAEVRRAEGFDARAHYRWSLPYLRAYAALLDPDTDDAADRRALAFLPTAGLRPTPVLSDDEIAAFIQSALF